MSRKLIPYMVRTGTRRNLDAARRLRWRLLVSAAGVWRTEDFEGWAADNGQWSERNNPGPFKADRFKRFVAWCMAQATPPDWIALPDIVMGGARSLALTMKWLRWFRSTGLADRVRLLIVVQDGMDTGPMLERIKVQLGDRVGIFVGGSTEWKHSTKAFWAALAGEHGAYCHVGRVNSAKRARECDIIGAHSFDGSGPSRFEKCLHQVDAAFDQPDLEGHIRRAA
jgi:hypothetical protein